MRAGTTSRRPPVRRRRKRRRILDATHTHGGVMNHSRKLTAALTAALTAVLAAASAPALADNRSSFAANLTGYQVTPLTLNSPASGEFAASVSNDGSAI